MGKNGGSRVLRAAALAGALASAGGLASAGQTARIDGPALITSLAGQGPNEVRTTIPISRKRGAEPRVVLSEPLDLGGGLRHGDVLRATAELQVTTTCVTPEPRCIGVPYGFTPRTDASLMLASNSSATGGRKAEPISGTKTINCNQQRPNRNHHCVFAFANAGKQIRQAGNEPCRPGSCFLNVVASADHKNASSGNVLVIGTDRPDGSVEGDKGRVDGFIERGDVPRAKKFENDEKMADKVPIEPENQDGQKVVRSLRLDGLEKGDVLQISAKQTMRISSVNYSVYIGTKVILAPGPKDKASKGFVNDVVSNRGDVTESNGFNCTQGRSAFEDPCTTKKAATVLIEGDLPQSGNGEPKPVFVNIVTAGLPKLATAGRNDRMEAEGGGIKVKRYRVE